MKDKLEKNVSLLTLSMATCATSTFQDCFFYSVGALFNFCITDLADLGWMKSNRGLWTK